MLTAFDSHRSSDCGRISRRDLLRIGALGIGGLTLPSLLAAKAAGAKAGGGRDYVRDKSIVLLFLCGGPSQIETFDPHMDRAAPQCSVTGEVKTSLPGVTFGGTFPKLAARAKDLAVVRSYSPHEIADHAKAIYHVLTGGEQPGMKASLGAMITRLRGQAFERGVPSFSELIEDEVDDQYREDMERMRLGNASGALGAASAPFAALGGQSLQQNMELSLPLARLEDRRQLHRALDRLARQIDAAGTMHALDEYESKAVEMLLGGKTREALDLSREDPKVVARYDTAQWQSGWLKKRTSTLGKRLLMARRLVEAGCGFVTVGMAGWDNHGNGNHPGVFDGMHWLGTPLDHAVSAFLDDVRQRGLSEKILLVITGEFGRGPKFENQGGRPHWPGLCPLVFAGGGMKCGQVIGKSLPTADYPSTDPYRLDHLTSTLMHAAFDLGKLRLDTGLPRELAMIAQRGEAIRDLL